MEDNSLCIRHSLESLKDTDGADGHCEAGGRGERIKEEGGDRGTTLMLQSQVPFHLQPHN